MPLFINMVLKKYPKQGIFYIKIVRMFGYD